MIPIDVLLSPAEQESLRHRDLSRTACAVFDVLRATTTLLEMLARGAAAVHPVGEIAEAVALRRADPELLLAGERHGLRITAADADGIPFDFGNSPREVRAATLEGRRLAMTTTNGTRALQACFGAQAVWVAAFTNLAATSRVLIQPSVQGLLLVCSGTGANPAYEDILGAGALIDRLLSQAGAPAYELSDTAQVALDTFRGHREDLATAIRAAANARRLLSIPDLAEDVSACLDTDRHDFAAQLHADGWVRRL
jgi:2-phosphosulfolactate phosphatase